MAALGLGLGLSKHSSYKLGSAFDPDYQAVLDYATANAIALPDEANQAIQNARLIAWKEAGIWATRDFVFHFEGSNANFALIDWKRLTMATAVNSPTYDATKGFASNGTSSYIDLNYNPTVGSNQWVNNNAGVLGKGHCTVSNPTNALHLGSTGTAYLSTPRLSNQNFVRLGESSSAFAVNNNLNGFSTFCGTKINTPRRGYFNGVEQGVIAISPALSSASLFTLRYQSIYSDATFSQSVLMGGASVSASQITDFHNSVI